MVVSSFWQISIEREEEDWWGMSRNLDRRKAQGCVRANANGGVKCWNHEMSRAEASHKPLVSRACG
jgi:hypothetical protein